MKKGGIVKSDKIRISGLYGSMCGIIWSGACFAQVYAIVILGVALGGSLIQTTIIISSFVGIIGFKELRGLRQQIIFWFGIILIVPSAFLMSLFKK